MFKESLDESWTDKEADKSLFTVWRKIYSDLLSINNTSSNLAHKSIMTMSFNKNVANPSF